jgi:hypothetical protein
MGFAIPSSPLGGITGSSRTKPIRGGLVSSSSWALDQRQEPPYAGLEFTVRASLQSTSGPFSIAVPHPPRSEGTPPRPRREHLFMVDGTEHEVVPPTVGLRKVGARSSAAIKRTTSGSSFHHLTGFQQDITNHPRFQLGQAPAGWTSRVDPCAL